MGKKLCMANLGLSFFLLILLTSAGFSQETVSRHVLVIPGLTFKEEMPRLDEASLGLKANPEKMILLECSNREGSKKSTALQRLKKSKEYLIKKHKISPKKIATRYRGTAPLGIELYIFIDEESRVLERLKESR